MSSLQAAIESRGQQIFELVDQHPESIFSKAGFYQKMMAFSMRDEAFKVQMFRFVDVLASLRRSDDIVEHLREYFHGMDSFVPMMQTGLKFAGFFPWLTAYILRRNVSGMARQFIAGGSTICTSTWCPWRVRCSGSPAARRCSGPAPIRTLR